jgi:DNA polymerase-3 subunit delta'
MLEEPPPRTVFILVADHVGRVPATIVSRCQKVLIEAPPREVALAWLRQHDASDAETALALCGGAPFAALELAADVDALRSHRELVGFLASPGMDSAMATAEAFGRSAAPPLIHWMQLWLADCISTRFAERIRYHPAQSKAIVKLAHAARVDALLGLMQRLTAIRRSVDHPLNTRLMLEGLLIAYADAMTPRP